MGKEEREARKAKRADKVKVPFKDRPAGIFLKGLGKGALKIADKWATGGVIFNKLEDRGPNSPAGKLDGKKWIRDIIMVTVPVVTLIGILKDWWTKEAVVKAIDIVTPIIELVSG